MLDFYIVTDCTEKGLYRKAKTVKRICSRNIEARFHKFQSPQDIRKAQDFCVENSIHVTSREWENLIMEGRLRVYAEKGTLDNPDVLPAHSAGAKSSDPPAPGGSHLPPDADVVIFTDGSYFEETDTYSACGGYAAIIIFRELADTETMTTGRVTKPGIDSTYMELTAICKALKKLRKYGMAGKKVNIYYDAQSLADDYQKKMEGWAECGWTKADGKHIKYHKLWKKIHKRQAALCCRLQLYWMKGHNRKNKFNSRCDAAARAEVLLRPT